MKMCNDILRLPYCHVISSTMFSREKKGYVTQCLFFAKSQLINFIIIL